MIIVAHLMRAKTRTHQTSVQNIKIDLAVNSSIAAILVLYETLYVLRALPKNVMYKPILRSLWLLSTVQVI